MLFLGDRVLARVVLVSAIAFAIAGCGGGGGGGGGGSAPTPPPANNPPIANAGVDFSGSLAAAGIALDGSGSRDPDGDTLVYSWRVQVHPTGADVSLDNATTAQPVLQTLYPGLYVIELEVTDGRGGQSLDTVELNLINDAPTLVVDPTPAQIAIGEPAGLDASGSTDANGHMLSYQWSLSSAPAASNLRSSFSGPAPLVEFDAVGTFEFSVEVSDGFATDTGTVSFTVSAYTERTLDHGFDYLASAAAAGATVSAAGNEVRIVALDGSTSQTLTLPAPVTRIAVSPNGEWVGVGHLSQVSIIAISSTSSARELGTEQSNSPNRLNASIAGTWNVSIPPGDLMIDNQGFAHVFSRSSSADKMVTVNPETGAETQGGGTIWVIYYGNEVEIHPSGLRAYGADNGLSPSDIERYDLDNGVLTYVRDSPYHGDFAFCGDLWVAGNGHEILTACGVVVNSTDDPSTDMTFKSQLARTGQILHAAHDASTGYWYVIEDVNGDIKLNVFDSDGGQWLETVQLPEILPGAAATPTRVFVDPDSGDLVIYAADHPTNPQTYQVFSRASVEREVLDYPPVTVVPFDMAGFVDDPIRVDASASYDPEGETITFQWAVVSQPSGSDIALSSTDQSALEFTPTHEGEYVLSLVTSDGERSAATNLVTVQAMSAGTSLQVRLFGTPTDVVYNSVHNQILYTLDDRNELRVRNLGDMSEWVMELDRPGNAIDVSPSGDYAVVSHAGLLSLVGLSATSASVIDTQAVSVDWGDVVIDDQGIAYTVPVRDQWVNFLAVDFANDVVHSRRGARAGTQLRMRPTGGAVYGADRGLSPSDIERYSVTDLSDIGLRDSPYHGQYAMGGNLWMNEQGNRLIVAGGHAFRVSDDPNLDMRFVETLAPFGYPTWADHSQEVGQWLLIMDNSVQVYSDTNYNQTDSITPDGLFIDAPGTRPILDRVYYSDDGSSIVVVAHSNAVTAHNYVVQLIE